MELTLNRLAADSSYGFYASTRSPVSEPPPFSPSFLLAVGLGSAIGGVARYSLTRLVQDRTDVAFPFGTLTVNVLGCLLIGIIIQASVSGGRMSDTTKLLLTSGFCGGFTTFSTFSYESIELIQNGAWSRAVIYVSVSVIAGLGAVWAGIAMVKAAFGAPR
jgi:CrcB protein